MIQNLPELPIISSVCKTAEDIIKSEYFIKGLDIILKHVPTFDKNYINSIFEKIRNKQPLDVNEKKNLILFVKNKKVSELWERLLSRMKKNSISINFNSIDDLNSFSDLLKEIFSEDWYRKIVDSIWTVAEIVELTLNRYKWFKRLLIRVNWEKKEIYLENDNLKVDSSTWKITTFKWVKVKINAQKDIIELIEWSAIWEQLFTRDAAVREATNLWKRLPLVHLGNPELQAIIKKVWEKEFMKNFPGSKAPWNWGFFDNNYSVYFRTGSSKFDKGSSKFDNKYNFSFDKWSNSSYIYWNDKSNFFSARCVKD